MVDIAFIRNDWLNMIHKPIEGRFLPLIILNSWIHFLFQSFECDLVSLRSATIVKNEYANVCRYHMMVKVNWKGVFLQFRVTAELSVAQYFRHTISSFATQSFVSIGYRIWTIKSRG